MLYSSSSEKIFEIGDKFYLVDLSFVEVHSKFGDRSINTFLDGGRFIKDEFLKGHPFIVVSDPYKVEYIRKWCEYRVDVMICEYEDTPVLSILNNKEDIIEDYRKYKNIIDLYDLYDFARLGGVL